MSTQFSRYLQILLTLLLPVLLVLGSVRLLITNQYLVFEYAKASFPPDSFGLDRFQRLAYASANFSYVREKQPLDALSRLLLDERPIYNERELKHMQDVQKVYQAAMRIWHLTLGFSLLAGLMLAWNVETRLALYSSLQWGGLLTAGMIAAIGVLAVLAWRVWFVAFHQIFFTPSTWSFNTSDTLIRLFPEKFWFDAALTISGLSLIGGLLLALVGWRLKLDR